MTKNELRKLYKRKRLELSASERLKLDDLLLIQLQRLAFAQPIETLMSFWPIERHCEMNTHLYMRYLEYLFPGLKVFFPVIDTATHQMLAVLVNDHTEFAENEFGIPEPENGEPVSPEEIDVVFVPLLAFDQQGNRVGYGKGFYDRFLTRCRADVITIGFSYFAPVNEIDDTGDYDIPLNYCITPEKIYEF